jgi:hypothetical protein
VRRAGTADARSPYSVAAITYRKGRRLYSVVAQNLPEWIAIHYLLHEAAHGLSWRQDWVEKHRPEHDDEWALWFGRVYRAWFDSGE